MKRFDNIFNHERERGDSRDFKRKKSGDRERPQMYEAICSDCGKRCEVPFKPTGDKPIYCSQCFTSHGGSSKFERGGRERPRHSDRPMFNAICDTCGKRFELPFRPTGEKPVYCDNCFNRGGSSSNGGDKQYKEQFDIINAKLDRIIKVLTPAVSVEERKEIVVEKKPKKTKKVEVKKKKSKK